MGKPNVSSGAPGAGFDRVSARIVRCRLRVAAVGAWLVVPQDAWAYIDPGIISALYQSGYALVLGILAAWVFKPWQYLKSRFKRNQAPDGEKIVEDQDGPDQSATETTNVSNDGKQ